MGYMQHTALLVTVCGDKIVKAHEKAKEMFNYEDESGLLVHPAQVTMIGGTGMNSYRSFAILPSGSKLGWDMQTKYVEILKEYIHYLDDEEIGQYMAVSYGEFGPLFHGTNTADCVGGGTDLEESELLE